ncbi:MAG: cation:proton antiporter domain-containing protein [Trinickia sp.]|uniref:cation:proton antiporter domain-containing protein n=1 Tax=Trinickia sp. TaxID=2571163 RepID=UPI003F7F7593
MAPNALMIGSAAAVLLSYWFNHLSRSYRVPSVMLLLLSGVLARVVTQAYHATVALPHALISTLGTAGLVLIVLEGALDLRLDLRRRRFLLSTFGAAALGVVLTTVALGAMMAILFGLPITLALLAGAPFGVISSAVAIPTAEMLDREEREFVIYESSWSDILGVMLFNALLVASTGGAVALHLIGGGFAVVALGLVVALGVYWLVGNLEGNVKFIPVLSALILVYAMADAIHLSPLLIVLILGLTLNNSQLLHGVGWLRWLHNDALEGELERLKHLTAELTFFVRTFFFLLLGYSTDITTLVDPHAWLYAIAIVALVFALRWPALRLTTGPGKRQALWIAPRGLITATLFFSLPTNVSALLPPATLVLVVLITGVVMSLGLKLGAQTSSVGNDSCA